MYSVPMTATIDRPLDLLAVHRAVDPKEKLRRAADVIVKAEKELERRRLRRNAAAVILFRRTNAEAMAAELPTQQWPMQPVAMYGEDAMDVSRSGWYKILDESDPGRLAELLGELQAATEEIAELPDDRAHEYGRLVREKAKLARLVTRHQVQVEAIGRLEVELVADPGIDLLAVVREKARQVHYLEELLKEAKPIRDLLAYELMNGVYADLYDNVTNSEVQKLSQLSSARVAGLRALR